MFRWRQELHDLMVGYGRPDNGGGGGHVGGGGDDGGNVGVDGVGARPMEVFEVVMVLRPMKVLEGVVLSMVMVLELVVLRLRTLLMFDA